MGMTLRDNQRDYYYDKLDNNFKGLKEKYIKYYGNKYNCMVPDYKKNYLEYLQLNAKNMEFYIEWMTL